MPHVRPSSRQPNPAPTPRSGPAKRRRAAVAIIGIGASAGGLDAASKLLGALPPRTGMVFILVQHLDPKHESLMSELLAHHTGMRVVQAAEAMKLETDHVYVIPPGSYLAVGRGRLRLSQPDARHGARLPFDFLLRSLAKEYGPRAAGIILSGTGADGSLGLRAVKEAGGLVIAQDPAEAAYDGMPGSAIAAGAVDLVLPLARIPEALLSFRHRLENPLAAPAAIPTRPPVDCLSEIIALLRIGKSHDFRLYKEGTLRRRIERRIAMAPGGAETMAQYLELLRANPKELAQLAADLLINVTSFFRDPKVFDLLASTIVPDLVRARARAEPLRVWIAGCSTGEETYSLAMLFHERIAAMNAEAKLQIFASDVDADAVATARDGLYPKSISASVSPERLARFFSSDDHGYRVLPELRASIVFAVQDVLTDPPFSRLDLISCRNLLIYLRPEAQEKLIAFFHFALRQGGVLLLGSAETVGNARGRFEIISKSERLYRHVGRSLPGETGLLFADGRVRTSARAAPSQPPSRQVALAEACRRLVMENYAPAAILVNHRFECLYSLGPTEQYLRVPRGHATQDLLAMVRPHLRTRLRAAIHQASQEKTRILIEGGRTSHRDQAGSFLVAVEPALIDGEDLMLVCLIDDLAPARTRNSAAGADDSEQVADLRQLLHTTQMELHAAIRSLESSDEEQKAINEEALSVNEEYQSTNEELLTSKEELQSMNEELTALNSQLQETLERQRTTASDLQNILYSTDVATIFLDIFLHIRFFTPATRALFSIIPSDLGRPLSDLKALTGDSDLLDDARLVLHVPAPIEREIQAANGLWYIRRILPYRAQDDRVEGVVVTFVDITERKRAADALDAARRDAQQANIAKSRFLAAASHDLRQPLQALSLMRGLLARKIQNDRKHEALALVTRLDETSAAMTGMLNTLLDINQLEAGTVHPQLVTFPIADLLDRLRDEFAYHAGAQNIDLRVVACRLSVHSDPRLLEQILRNLLSNALKYTSEGRVLLGCRRRADILRVEVWDTGIGIAAPDLRSIFDEYHQVGNTARERNLGLGLGLSIVQRLATLLGHPIQVRSQPGKGSVFSIDVALPLGVASSHGIPPPAAHGAAPGAIRPVGSILVIEDDRDVRALLETILSEDGHRIAAAPDGPAALALVTHGIVRPDIILADFNLPNGIDGLEAASRIRASLPGHVPVLILTGDISTDALKRIAGQDCVQLNKPVRANDLTDLIQTLLLPAQPNSHLPPRAAAAPGENPIIHIVDDDGNFRSGIRSLIESSGHEVEDYASSEEFIAAFRPGDRGCLLVDAYLPGMSGLELLKHLQGGDGCLPAIMITGNSDVAMAVQAMKSGATDFIEKPVSHEDLLVSIRRALELSQDANKRTAWRRDAAACIGRLTPRQRQIMDLVLAGRPSKNIAADLGLSQRTVENHRAQIMHKTGAKSLPALARLALISAQEAQPAGLT